MKIKITTQLILSDKGPTDVYKKNNVVDWTLELSCRIVSTNL